MTTWNDFATNAINRENWIVRDGEAFWVKEKPKLVAHVRIAAHPTTLHPDQERLQLALSDEDVLFEAFFISKSEVTFLEARMFTEEWLNLWGEEEVWISLTDSPPPGHVPPETLDFTPEHYEKFDQLKISETSLAPVWGQPREYFGEQEWELNAFGRMSNDPRIKYQQEWVEENLECPFCEHIDWNETYACVLKEPEIWVYDKHKQYYVLLCPKCERCVEALPRQIIKEL